MNKDRILIYGSINREDTIEPLNQILEKIKNEEEIELWICSNGGIYEYGMGIADILNSYPKTKAIAMGYVYSSAMSIYLACNERLSYPNTLFMAHEGRTDFGHEIVDITRISSEYKCMEKMNRMYFDFLSQNISGDISEFYKKQTHFTADEALKLGVCHDIIKRNE